MDQPNLEPISVENDHGIILSGVGVSEDALRETMEARAEPPADGAEGEAEPAAPVTDPGTAAESTGPPRSPDGKFTKPPRGQKRFDQLTKEREAEKSARAAAEQRAQELEARLAALEQARTAPAAAPAESKPAPAAQADPAKAPRLAEFTNDPQYGTYEDALEAYYEARAAHDRQDFDARLQSRIEAERASRAFDSHLATVWDAGRKAYPDFDAVVARSTVVFPDPVRMWIVQAPNASDLMYALAADDALAQRIASIADPITLGAELARVVPPKASASPASPPSALSNAPAPYQPVGSGTKTAMPTLDELAASGGDDFDKSGYRERRRAERLAGRR